MKRKTWIILSLLAAILFAVLGFCIKQYYHFAVANFRSYDNEAHSYHVHPEASADSILAEMLEDYEMLSDMAWCMYCNHMQYTHPKPGHYRFAAEISNRELIRRLQLGEETPIKLSFNPLLFSS